MNRSYDEVQAIAGLVQSVAAQLNDSAEHVQKLQSLASNLVPKSEFECLCQPPPPDQPQQAPEFDEEQLLIIQLERNRIDLIMSLQRQEFVSEKLSELIHQNQDMLDTIQEYLETKDSIRQEEEEAADKRFATYVDDTLQTTENKLNESLREMNAGINKVANLIPEYIENIEDNTKILVSSEYQLKVNALVNNLNK